MKVLVIEDSENMRKLLKRCIEKEGFRVIGEAFDGDAGITRYKELKPDIVILDIAMPGTDGIACLKEIRKFDEQAKILICSVMNQKNVIDLAIKLGAQDYITKPFNVNELVQKLKEINGNSKDKN